MPVYKKAQKVKKTKKTTKKKSVQKPEEPPVGILVCGELSSETINSVWEAYDDDREFILTLCSPGGDIIVYHALLDFLGHAREQGRLTTVGMGECFSGAPLLLAGGSEGRRVAYKSTLFGLHEPFLTQVPPDPGAQFTVLKQLESIKDQYYGFLAQFTKHRQAWWRERLEGKSMWHMDAKEAMKLGIIDGVIE